MTEEDQNSFWWRLVHLDPAIYRGLVVAIVAALASAGVVIAPGIPDAVIGLIVVVASFVQAVWTKRGTTANAKVAVEVPDPVNAPDVVIAGGATTTATTREIVDAARADGRA